MRPRTPLAEQLNAHLRAQCKSAGLNPKLDTYDLDFIIGSTMEFLQKNGLALTGKGVQRLRSKG